MNYIISCIGCKQSFTDQWWLCPRCGDSLLVTYPNTLGAPQYPLKNTPSDRPGIGNTALLKLNTISVDTECEVWAKCEFQNLSGSFKDRGSVLEIQKAVELGKTNVICASTGNMAASLSAIAAIYKLACTVIVPKNTPRSKLKQAWMCGAKLQTIDGTYDHCVREAQIQSRNNNAFICGDYLLRREGQKSVGWELADKNFDSFIVPVGNGTLGIAIAQGMWEANEANRAQFIGVQASQVNPIQSAWKHNHEIQSVQNKTTIASAMLVGNPLDGNLTLSWVRKTHGAMFAVSDEQISLSQQNLARREGIYVESTAAATLAALYQNKAYFKDKKVVLILTGNGLKEQEVN